MTDIPIELQNQLDAMKDFNNWKLKSPAEQVIPEYDEDGYDEYYFQIEFDGHKYDIVFCVDSGESREDINGSWIEGKATCVTHFDNNQWATSGVGLFNDLCDVVTSFNEHILEKYEHIERIKNG